MFDVFHDIAHRMPTFDCRVVLDVGANIGQTVRVFKYVYPNAEIHAFEPDPENFERLSRSCSQLQRVSVYQLAMGRVAGFGTLYRSEKDTMHSLVCHDRLISRGEGVRVPVTTLDEFCFQHNVSHIDYLKIDTEGLDLDVVAGAKRILEADVVRMIEVECGMYRGNERHVYYESFIKMLEPLGYLLFGIYDQMHEWTKEHPNLRRANLVFISNSLLNSHRAPNG